MNPLKKKLFVLIALIVIGTLYAPAQEHNNSATVGEAVYFDVFGPLKNIPPLSSSELDELNRHENQMVRNNKLKNRKYPFASTAQPVGNDPVWQKSMGSTNISSRDIQQNWDGQSTDSYPPDCNGAVGPDNYFQTVNVTYSVYDKTGTQQIAATALNTIFSGVPGSSDNDGDPIVMYDEQANRWFVAEFSLNNMQPPYRMMVAVSVTGDPTGNWYRWSFDMGSEIPDYPKFGVWKNGYYMGTNSFINNICAFERDVMLAGGSNPKIVKFDYMQGPNTDFMCIMPVDNDGIFAPENSPALFACVNDDAWGGNDEIWIYELDVDWSNPNAATFNRSQQISVAPFDSDFGQTWDNIAQPGTSQKLDAIPQVLMNRVQYRNFGDTERIVCNHTVDVDNTDHAGIRWYELEKTGGSWAIRQQSTYAPDDNSRWMASIAINQNKEIGIGYSVSSTSVYPGIRYCGQSANANNNATSTFDIAEEIIIEGTNSQFGKERWGDYSNISVDPSDDQTFWYTNQYIKPSSLKGTRIASFQLGAAVLNANFVADNTTPDLNNLVNFTDLSSGGATSWEWEFTPTTINYLNGTNQNSQNPKVEFTAEGYYKVSLTISDGTGSDTEIKENYINVIYTGIDGYEEEIFNSIFAYNHEIIINLPENSNFNVTVYELSGKKVAKSNHTGQSIKLYKPGNYIVQVITDKLTVSKIVFVN